MYYYLVDVDCSYYVTKSLKKLKSTLTTRFIILTKEEYEDAVGYLFKYEPSLKISN